MERLFKGDSRLLNRKKIGVFKYFFGKSFCMAPNNFLN